MEALLPRELKFAMAYLRTSNATDAAIEAGYKPGSEVDGKNPARKKSNARIRGMVLLRIPRVSAFIRREMERIYEAERMTVGEILARLARVARTDPAGIFNDDGSYKKITEMDPEVRACIRGFEDELKFDEDGAPPTMTRKVKMADPVPALRILAQVSNLLSPEAAQVNIFLDLDARLDAAAKRLAKSKEVEISKVVSEQ